MPPPTFRRCAPLPVHSTNAHYHLCTSPAYAAGAQTYLGHQNEMLLVELLHAERRGAARPQRCVALLCLLLHVCFRHGGCARQSAPTADATEAAVTARGEGGARGKTLWTDVATAQDDEVLEPSAHEQLALVQKAQVARAQVLHHVPEAIIRPRTSFTPQHLPQADEQANPKNAATQPIIPGLLDEAKSVEQAEARHPSWALDH
jgi:hypothetical protein